MRLLFICTSLQPGRDGVGDYTRLLADECINAGHQAQMVAINDEHLLSGGAEWQQGPNHEIHCVRMSPSERWDQRNATLHAVIHDFDPDWISWQVVPYGFHPKGLIPPQVAALGELGRNRCVHVMLHELWIGLSRGEPMKNLAYGALQKRRMLQFLRALRPTVIHTSNVTYQTVLAREGCTASILPLFGNVPVTELVPPVPNPSEWIGGIFGTVHPQLDFQLCFDTLAEGAKASGRRLRILGIGHLGTFGNQMFAQMAQEYAGVIETTVVGEKEPAEISRLLQTLDFGIATHPWALAGKSGAVAAMLDHGLPVVVPRDDWVLRVRPIVVPAIDRLVVQLSEMPPELMAGRMAQRQTPAPRLPSIAGLFVENLEALSANLQLDA